MEVPFPYIMGLNSFWRKEYDTGSEREKKKKKRKKKKVSMKFTK